MENHGKKRLDLSEIDLRRLGMIGGLAVLLALLIALCITINMRSHIQSEYTNARNEIGEEIYTELYMLCQTFDQVTVPGQDVQNGVIPTMQEYYLAAQTLNTALTNAFGERYAVLTGEHIAALDGAFEAYDTAFRGGKSTDNAESAMRSGMDMVRGILETRFRDGSLKAA